MLSFFFCRQLLHSSVLLLFVFAQDRQEFAAFSLAARDRADKYDEM
jgi:hypothetical protein